MTETEALAAIAALCDEVPEYAGQPTLHFRDLVRAVLGEAQPTPPHGTDLRDALIDVLNDAVNAGRRGGSVVTLNGYATRILALVRPVEGVVLIPEDPRIARIAALCDEIDREAEEDPNGGFGPGMQAVAREVRALLKEASSS